MTIISGILIILSVFLFTPSVHAAMYETTGNGLEIELNGKTPHASDSLTELRELNRQLQQLFKTGRRESRTRIVLTGAVPPGEIQLRQSPGMLRIEFDDSDPGWVNNRVLRRKLMGILLATHGPGPFSGELPDYFPNWIAAGIEHRIQTRRTSALLLKRNLDFRITRALLEAGPLPDFQALTEIPAEAIDGDALQLWYDELSRVLLEAVFELGSRKENVLAEYVNQISRQLPAARIYQTYLVNHFQTRADNTSLAERIGQTEWKKLSPQVKAQRYLEFFADRLAHNQYFPRSVRELHKQFAIFRVVMLPEADAPPEAPLKAYDLMEIPERLEEGIPEVIPALRKKLAELRMTAEGGDLLYREKIAALAEAMYQLIDGSRSRKSYEQYRNALRAIEQVLERRRQIEEALELNETRFRSPFFHYRDAIREAARPNAGETTRIGRQLNEVEEFYLEE